MFSSSEKTVKPAARVLRHAEQGPFFSGKEPAARETEDTSFFPAMGVQARLTVSMPGDPLEHEADTTAEQVLRMPDPVPLVQSSAPDERLDRSEQEETDHEEEDLMSPGTGVTHVQRQAVDEEEEEEGTLQARFVPGVQRHASPCPAVGCSEEEANTAIQPRLHRKNISRFASDIVLRSGRGPPAANKTFEHTLRSAHGGGSALPEQTRDFMESRFGADFSGVRVHTDARAQEMNREIYAQAFTHGSDIYFNSGRYDPETPAGKSLLAHELTHTIQQGASPLHSGEGSPGTPSVSVQRRSNAFDAVQRRASVPQLEQAVVLAQGEQGKVIANGEGPDGCRVGWERLIEYFETSFGKDKILNHQASVPGTVWRGHIKKKSTFMGQVPNQTDPNLRAERDAMPSWCGIFVFWSLNKAGVPMPKWTLGESMIPDEAAYPAGHTPMAGDIAYRNRLSHFGIVVRSEGSSIVSVNGNTAGEDNLGGEVQEQTHSIEQWDGFFNPLAMATGSLRDPALGDEETEPRSLRELRRDKFNAQRKAEDQQEIEDAADESESDSSELRRSVERTTLTVDPFGRVQRQDIGESEEEEIEEDIQRSSESPAVDAIADSDDEEDDTVQRMGESESADSSIIEDEEEEAPVQRKTLGQRIRSLMPSRPAALQASWLGDAWDAVSGVVSEAVSYIEQGIDAAKDWLLGKVRDFVMDIPGYKLLRVILEYDPITGESVSRTGETLLTAVLDLLPIGSRMVRSVLDYFNATVPVSTFLLSAVVSFVGLIQSVGSRFERLWDGLSLDDVADPDGVIDRIAGVFRGIVTDIVDFAVECGTTFLTMVKDIAITNIVQFVQNHFPNAFDLLCVVLGENPVTKEAVPRTGANILNAGLTVLGERGTQIRAQMMENGIFQQCVAWIDRTISVVTNTVADISQAFTTIWEELSFESLFHPIDTFMMIVDNFRTPVTRVVDFIGDAVIALLRILKDALLERLSAYARDTRGYFLITVILGRDVFTGQQVERNAENLIRGFMSLMEGGEEQFQQMKESGAIDRTTQKINAAVRRLNFTWAYIVGLFTSLWESMDWTDFLNPITAFGRIVATFGQPVRRLVAFVVEIVRIVIEVLLVVMNFPVDTVTQIIARVLTVIDAVKRDPVGFLKNLLRAIKQGFIQFFDNILSHLLNGLADWFFHQLGDLGIERPPDLSFRSILRLIMQILGISLQQIMDKVWRKLAEKIGQEKVDRIRSMIDRLEGIWSFIRDVMDRGPVAIWEYVQEKLSNLWTIVLDAAKTWIMEKIITAIVTKLLSMLDPTGIMAVINSVIAVYRAIQSFIEYLRQMLEIVNSFVGGIAELATGNIRVAADFLERTMARAIPIIIGFLANQVGLGRIGRKLAEIIGKIREKVDKAIDWLIDKAISVGGRFLARLRDVGRRVASAIRRWLGLEHRFASRDGQQHRLYFSGSEDNPTLMVQSNPTPFASFIESVQVDAAAEGGQEKAAAKQQALTVAQRIDAKRRERLEGSTDAEKEESKARKVEEVQALLRTLATHTALLFGDASDIGRSEIEHEPASAGSNTFGRFARGFKLATGKFDRGTPPTQARHDIYDALNLRRQAGGASYYIRGHLLNDNLGGVGQWHNMTPLSREGNHQHEAQVESAVKAAVDSGAIVEYTIRPTYSTRGRAQALKRAFAEDSDPQAEIKGRIVDAEERVPTAMQCSAYILEKQGETYRQKQTIVSTSVPNPVQQEASAYHLSGTPPPPTVYLSEASVAEMAAVPEIGSALAPLIVQARAAGGSQSFRNYTALSEATQGEESTPIFNAEQRGRIRALSGVDRVRLYRTTG